MLVGVDSLAPLAVHREPAIAVSGITKVFGVMPALVGVELRAEPGEVVALRGPNGAGKSTLLAILATLVAPTRGRGRVLGHDLLTERERIRAGLEYLGHRTRLYEDLTARENLRFAARLHGEGLERVPAVLELVGLAGFQDDRVRGFSQGMRRRLAIARMLLRRPRLLLLDEPYAGLDSDGHELLDHVLAGAAHGGATVVMAMHGAARPLLQARTVMLRDGRMSRP